MKAVMGYEAPVVPPPKDYKGDFFKDVAGALVGVLFCGINQYLHYFCLGWCGSHSKQ